MKIDFISDINKDYEDSLNYKKVDRLIVNILWWHLGLFTALALINSLLKPAEIYPSPFWWRAITIPEALISIVIAATATIIPALAIGKMRNHYHWRILITTALTFYSYLFVFISGGSIEMHFHFFMIIALLVIYADWRLGWILLVLTGLHHGILNYIEPGWVYFYGRNDFAVIAHSLPVLGAVIFTTVLCQADRDRIIELKEAKGGLEKTVEERTNELKEINMSLDQKVRERTRELEHLKSNLEKTVEEKTQDLQKQLAEVGKLNEIMIGRELKMAEMDKELIALRQKLQNQNN